MAGAFARRTTSTAQRVWQSDALYATRIALIVAVAYFVGAIIGIAFGFPTTQISVFWPPNVVLIVALLRVPRRLWWVIIAAGLPAEVVGFAFGDAPVPVSALYYASNAGQALLTALLLQRYCGGAPRFNNFFSTAWFIVIAALIAPAVMSLLLAVPAAAVGWIEDGWVFWQARFLTDALSALTLIPLALATLKITRAGLKRVRPARVFEAGLLVICLVIVGALVHGNRLSQAMNLPVFLYAPIPLFLWAGMRFGVTGVSLSVLITSLISLWSASYGLGPFATQSAASSVLSLQLFMIEVGVPLMLMAALLDERRASIAALRDGNEQIHRLASQLITAQEEERRRVARELHDEVGQALTTVKISLDTMRLAQDMPDAPDLPAPPALLDESVARVDHALEQVRNLSLLLRPSMLDDLGLAPALRWLANSQAERAGYRVMFTADTLTPRPSQNIETVCYRVAQEALTNIARHAQAGNVFIRLQVAGAQLRLTIRDDGVGFDVGEMRQRAAAGSSMGVLGMEERAILGGGKLTIQSLPGRGTTLELNVPYVASPAPDVDEVDEPAPAAPAAPDTAPKALTKFVQPPRERKSDAAAAPALLKTKFHAPRADRRWLARPRLLDLLDRGGSPGIVLIIAPAGFGKTTLIGQWLAQRDEVGSGKRAVAWLSLEASDSAPERFFGYLIAAICDAVPTACAGVKNLTGGTHFPPLNVVTDALLNDLAILPGPFTIVLDDYHAITNEAIHTTMARVLDQLPDGVNAVVASREAPPWPLSRMRAEGRLNELDAAELAFTLDEARALLGGEAARESHSAETVHRRTEGWPLGLQLARISLRDLPHAAAGVNETLSADRYTASYLVEEVLSRQPDDVQRFLLISALPDTFCASLCDALRDSEDLSSRTSEDMLAWLEQRNLFLAPLDDERTWYRYHHLLRDVLLDRLQGSVDSRRVEHLHLAASGWLQEHGLIEEAVRHAVLGGQPVRAARMVERYYFAMQADTDHLSVFRAYKPLLPAAVLASRPAVLANEALAAFGVGDTLAMADFVARADALLEQPPEDMATEELLVTRSDLDWLRGVVQIEAGELEAARQSSARALQHLPSAQRDRQILAMTNDVTALGLLGNVRAALRSFEDMLAASPDPVAGTTTLVLTRLSRLEAIIGDLDRLLTTGSRLAEKLPGSHKYWTNRGHFVLGYVMLERHELTAAAQHFQLVADDPYCAYPRTVHESLAGLTLIAMAQGDASGAWEWARRSRTFAEDLSFAYARELAAALEAGLALWQGDLDAAVQRLSKLQPHTFIGTSPWPMEPRLRRAQVQIACGDPQAIAEAVTDLRACLRDAERVHNARQAIEVRALLALGLNAQGETGAALTLLSQAVEAATPQGFIRPFIDLGPPMAELLAQLAASAQVETEVGHHIGRIQAAFSSVRTRT